MNNVVADLTPADNPIGIAREMVQRAAEQKCRAGIVLLVSEDGSLWYRSCGKERAYVMWALQRMVHQLMQDEPELEDK